MNKFLMRIKEEYNDKKAVDLLNRLPDDAISLTNDKLAPCATMMHEGVACHGYTEEIHRTSIMVNLPNEASEIFVGNGGVDFDYKNHRYSIRAGIVKSRKRHDWVPITEKFAYDKLIK